MPKQEIITQESQTSLPLYLPNRRIYAQSTPSGIPGLQEEMREFPKLILQSLLAFLEGAIAKTEKRNAVLIGGDIRSYNSNEIECNAAWILEQGAIYYLAPMTLRPAPNAMTGFYEMRLEQSTGEPVAMDFYDPEQNRALQAQADTKELFVIRVIENYSTTSQAPTLTQAHIKWIEYKRDQSGIREATMNHHLRKSFKTIIRELNTSIANTDRKAEQRLQAKDRHLVGEVFFMPDYLAPSASFPAYCLSQRDSILNQSKWPELVPFLYNIRLRYNTTDTTGLAITNWRITNNEAYLYFASSTAQSMLFAALAEDRLVQTSYNNWRSITLLNDIGSIRSGAYAIANLNLSSRYISFTYIAANASGNHEGTAYFYPYRIPARSDRIRILQTAARSIFTVGQDKDGAWLAGLRKRDQMQDHKHIDAGHSHSLTAYHGGTNFRVAAAAHSARGDRSAQENTSSAKASLGGPSSNDHGSINTGYHNRSQGIALYPYIWGGRYVS